MAVSPTQRALADCKRLGMRAAIVEKWLAHTRQRKDVWGFGDLLVLDGKPGSVLVQVCARASAAVRIAKILSDPCRSAARDWVAAGNRVEVWDYAINKTEGGRRRYTRRVTSITIDMLKGDDHDERSATASAAPGAPA